MVTDRFPQLSARRRFERILGDIPGEAAGPTLVFVAGLNGNEPAGALASERVAAALRERGAELRGRVVFVSGNRQGLAAGLRFVRRDLNRGWTEPQLARLRALPERALGDEDQEQRELAECLYQIERERRARMIVVDLHTGSAPSAPVVSFGDTLLNRRLALSLPAPCILGLEEVVEGALVSYWTDRGHASLAIEAGQHQDAESVERLVAAIWLLLIAAGCLRASAVPDLAQHRERLALASAGCPAVVEVRHRHVVAAGDQFAMEPGFRSFQSVQRGQLLARDVRGPVLAPEAGSILMPRYQSQGEEGFLLVREVRPVWLKISEWLRRAGVSRVVPHLPGVRRDPARPGHLLVDPTVAFAHVADVMHLCGFRRRGSVDKYLLFSTRRPVRLRRPTSTGKLPARLQRES
jgi:succinylglutamate desuccinylase